MHRRALLRQMGAVTAGCGAGFGAALFESRAAASFGTPPGDAVALPAELRADSVLEIFLCGGVSQYESFYCVPEHGVADRTHFHLFSGTPEFEAELASCGFSGDLTEPFAPDTLGQLVHFGPFVAPLRARPDVLERVRVSVTAHRLAPHEAAIPLALSGRSLGDPGLAGLGAHVQRYFAERDGAAGSESAFALLSSSLGALPIDNLRAVVATGLHPASARPLAISVDRASTLVGLLERGTLGEQRAAYDQLLAGYTAAYRDELRWGAGGEPTRSRPFLDFAASASSLTRVDELASRIEPASIALAPGTSCGQSTPADAVAAQLELAARLLTHPTRPARYVCVVDGGFIPAGNGGGAYDSHGENTVIQARNLGSTLRTLLSLVRAPGDLSPHKIDLDRTLILLTTEFGRTPGAEGSSGRNHFPYGYANVLIGGPIRTRGVAGGVGPDARGVDFSSPAETRVAALLALGIWPFSSDAFSTSDVEGALTEREAAALVLERQLGFVA